MGVSEQAQETKVSQAKKGDSAARVRSIAFCGLTIAILAVSAWVSVPFGPVPFTLQTFALMFAVLALQPKEAVASVAGYLLLGAVGVPVFSSMRGGIGVLAGPTGGFLWGFLLGTIAAVAVLWALRGVMARGRAAEIAVSVVAAIVLLAFSYVCGWGQMVALLGMSPAEAFAVGVAPFLPIEVGKLIAAVAVALAVKRAIGR